MWTKINLPIEKRIFNIQISYWDCICLLRKGWDIITLYLLVSLKLLCPWFRQECFVWIRLQMHCKQVIISLQCYKNYSQQAGSVTPLLRLSSMFKGLGWGYEGFHDQVSKRKKITYKKTRIFSIQMTYEIAYVCCGKDEVLYLLVVLKPLCPCFRQECFVYIRSIKKKCFIYSRFFEGMLTANIL